MIKTFKDKETRLFLDRGIKPRNLPPKLVTKALEKLAMVHASKKLTDFYVPPSNHFESLKGDRKGQYSIMINDKYRICFSFNEDEGNAYDVEITNHYR